MIPAQILKNKVNNSEAGLKQGLSLAAHRSSERAEQRTKAEEVSISSKLAEAFHLRNLASLHSPVSLHRDFAKVHSAVADNAAGRD